MKIWMKKNKFTATVSNRLNHEKTPIILKGLVLSIFLQSDVECQSKSPVEADKKRVTRTRSGKNIALSSPPLNLTLHLGRPKEEPLLIR